MRNWTQRNQQISLLCVIAVLQLAIGVRANAQSATAETVAQQLDRLSEAIKLTEEQVAASQKQLVDLRRELEALKEQIAGQQDSTVRPGNSDSATPDQSSQNKLPAQTLEDLSERQAVQQAEIATHEQSKIESESKYPVKISGLILFSTFSNSSTVDTSVTPSIALPGHGSTGASLRQTILGIDARGPHLFGALSSADLRVDFNGTTASGTYNNTAGLARLRTAHAALNWHTTQIFFALDRPIISPNEPSSLTAVALPALAWSGNLWSWNPQFGIQHDVKFTPTYQLRLQTALIDVADPPQNYVSTTTQSQSAPSASESSRWPGTQARIALLGIDTRHPEEFGIGGYFSPHQTPYGRSFDAWAATLDYRLPLPAHWQWSGYAYRGLALGGLGGGAFKDYVYALDPDLQTTYVQPLDDIGGWTQMKQRISERFEWNIAYGIDNVFAGELRPYAGPTPGLYQNLARNRTFYSNVIYGPSAYLLLSLYIFGLAAAYKF